MEDQLLVTILAIITFAYGAGTSYLQERFGGYDKLPPNIKQLINSIINLVIPYLAVFFQPYWRLEFGDLSQALTSLLLLVAPIAVWLFSQFGHQVDKALAKVGQ